MIVLICEDVVKREKLEEVREYYRELVEYTRKQPGCLAYDVYQDEERDNVLIFVEKWADASCLDDHLKDNVYIEMFAKIEKHLTGEEKLRRYGEFV